MTAELTAMRSAVGGLVAAMLLTLGAIHLFWAVRRRPVSSAVVPVVDGRRVFEPTPLQTVAVAAGLVLAAALVLRCAGLATGVSPFAARVGCAIVGVAFVGRAIGEFRLVGFFKSIRGTRFARLDSWLYSPLCLAIGAAVIWLAASGPE